MISKLTPNPPGFVHNSGPGNGLFGAQHHFVTSSVTGSIPLELYVLAGLSFRDTSCDDARAVKA